MGLRDVAYVGLIAGLTLTGDSAQNYQTSTINPQSRITSSAFDDSDKQLIYETHRELWANALSPEERKMYEFILKFEKKDAELREGIESGKLKMPHLLFTELE